MPRTSRRDEVDFSLHGFVGIRLIDATPEDVGIVERQLGPMRGPIAGAPDIVCRFVDRLPISGPVRYLGLNDAGFTDDAYLVLRSKHKSRARVQVPLGSVGGACEIVCERGVSAVPLLIAIVNLTALTKGYVPLHASAAFHRNQGILIAGWAKGGKTELLLGLMANGARYIGDEWIYLAPGGAAMYGIPEPIKIWAAHLAAMPAIRAAVPVGERMRLASLAIGASAARGASEVARGTPPGRLLRRVAPVLEQQAAVHVEPRRLFGPNQGDLTGPIDVVVLALSAESQSVTVEPADPTEIARRMTFSVQHERLDLLGHYLRFRYAFPEASNPNIEQAEERQRQLLSAALADRRAYTITHPYPAPIPRMYAELSRCLL
jgi:hypothetical protein